jgi:hypothetical protein
VNYLGMRDFVEHISKLASSTIREYSNIVRAVVASAIDERGEELFPRTWNEEFIDAPIIKHQKQPTTDEKGMESILKEADGQYRVLYGKHISEDCRTLYTRQKAKRGMIQPYK